ncbi:adhesion G-protein coupled receptor G6 isoform X2 [Nerophis ophidion]|uniref:adhesion G-protein coupled receptor G6 isoform X2 n=1 Tax=Nerophis ophidion TaxID=159077 RepID=UPI002ADF711A|nr:adhesion G-protein coupled receptor G6 isoform X2 [Nerophis ophidion]
MAACRRNVVVMVFLLWAGLDTHVHACECVGPWLREEEAGLLASPCYPQQYPNSQSCRWRLQAPPGFVVQLTFVDFQLEEAPGCVYDRVAVHGGGGRVDLCGLTAHGLTLNSSGNVMDVEFTSDFSVQKKGFRAIFRHVAVALRNLKVGVAGGNGQFATVSSSVAMPTLHHLTLCFDLERSGHQQVEWIFTYKGEDGNTTLALGGDQSGVKLVVGGVTCLLDSIMTPADWSVSMKNMCLLWSSSNGRVGIFLEGNHRVKTCSASTGISVAGGGTFRLGGVHSFEGNVYNMRLWDYAMTVQQLSALKCHVAGNIIDWDNTFWDIPSTLTQKDHSLSCSVSSPSNTTLNTLCDSIRLGCPATSSSTASTNSIHTTNVTEVVFYKLSLVVNDESATLTQADVEEVVSSWLNQTFQNWTHLVFVDSVSVQSVLVPGGLSSFTSRALLLHNDITDQSPGPDTLSARISSRHAHIGAGLGVHKTSIQVTAVDTCPEDNTVHYRWPETRPSITRLLPCFPNKERSAARKCLMDRHNFSSFWSPTDFHNCTDIDAIQVSAENAAAVAAQLAAIANNQLSKEEVSKVVSKVKQLVHVAKINTTLASAVITVISNVMSSPHSALAPTSDRALKTVDQLLDKLEFEGSSVSITSRRLSLGVVSFNASTFNGTSFSAFILPNATDPEIDFESERTDPLAQVTLPASLLTGASFSEARINFLFFRSTNLFQSEQDGRALNSYVVASSVGNWSVSDLSDPVQIEMVHLSPQAFLNPVCVFWDFSMNYGAGGWNADGCRVSKEASSTNRTVCLCDHLTHFGILMDISGVSPHIDRRNNRILTFISFVGCGVSAIFSAATLLTYVAFEKLRRDYPSKILMNLSASLLLLNMAFLLNGWLSGQRSEALCLAAAVLLHYFLLTSFTWMGLESVHMYIALVKVFNTYVRRYILKFCLLGWGIPAVLVGTVVAVNKRSYGPQEYGGGEFGDGSSAFCWIQSPLVFYTACVAYFCLVFLLNVAMFVVVMLQICGRNGKRSNRTLREEVVRNLRSVVSLTFLLGMTWSFALFAWGPVSLIFVYLFAIFNSLQGLFIFLFHCALKENVQKQWRRSLCCARFRLSDNSDWSKTATNNTKKATSEQAVQSLSSGSFGSSAANWTSKAKVTLKPFTRNNNTESCWSQ